jgi:serine/threonine protein kinase
MAHPKPAKIPRKHRGVTQLSVPSKTESPDELPSCPFWFKYVTQTFHARKRAVDLQDDVTNEELGFNQVQRSKAEKSTESNKRNHFIRDTLSNTIFFIKESVNVERSYKEWIINQQLANFNVPHVIPAIGWCQGKPYKDSGDIHGFLVLPYVKSYSMTALTAASPPIQLRDVDWLKGLKQLVEFFVAVDPAELGDRLRLNHKDFKKDQILYDPHSGNWYIIDFGLAEAWWEGTLPGEVSVKATIRISVSSSVSSPADEFESLVNMFRAEIDSSEVLREMKALKGRPRRAWLDAMDKLLAIASSSSA